MVAANQKDTNTAGKPNKLYKEEINSAFQMLFQYKSFFLQFFLQQTLDMQLFYSICHWLLIAFEKNVKKIIIKTKKPKVS